MHPSKNNRFCGFELELARPLCNVIYSERDKNARWTQLQKQLQIIAAAGNIRPGWELHPDRSCGGEIVSPKLRFSDGAFKDIAHICNAVNGLSAQSGMPTADGECGLHIHFDAIDITAANLSAIFAILYRIEPILFSIYTDRHSGFCAPISVPMYAATRMRKWVPDVRDVWYRVENNLKDAPLAKKYTPQFINSKEQGNRYDGTRYHGFNIHCYWRLGTIEFRYARGTFDIEKIWAFYDLCSSIIEHAISRKKIPVIDNQVPFQNLLQSATGNFQFRNNFINMCKSLNLSRDTIRIFISMLKTDNAKLLEKNPAEVIRWICNSNRDRFVISTQIGIFNLDGKMLPSTAIISNIKETISAVAKLENDKVNLIWPKNVRVETEVVVPEEIVKKLKEKPVIADLGVDGIKFIE